MKTSPSHEIHKSLGAKFVEIGGWEIPAHYGNPLEEHLNVRKGVGIMDLVHRGKVRISGKDRTMYLQKILSQDINKLAPFGGAYTTLLDVKGRMLAYMRLYCDMDSFLIDVEPGLAEKIVQIFTQYLFREDVIVEDITEKYGLITIQGPQSRELLSSVTRTEIKDLPECSHLNLHINDVSCKVVRTSYTGEEGYDIYALWDETASVWEAIETRDTSHIPRNMDRNVGSVPLPFGLNALETLRIEAGTPVYSIDMDEHTIPIEANLDKAISYDKGCYIGQETIARIKFRGHVNRTLTGFLINPPSPPFIKGAGLPLLRSIATGRGGLLDKEITPEKGDRVYKVIDDTEQDIGVITSGCFSPTLNRPIALGYIRIEYKEQGGVVSIDRDAKRLTAAVTPLPFYKRP